MMNTWNPAEIMERLNRLESIVKAIPSPTTVVANPEGEASTDLEKLTVGETIYGIPEGVNVVANPETESSGNLTKITIGETTYAISQGANIVTYTATVNVPSNGFISSIPDEIGTGTLNIDHAQVLNIDYESYPSALRCFVTATGTSGAIGANVYDSTSMQKMTGLGNISVRITIIKY